MTKTIRSESNPNTRYFLTIDDETGQAVDCACPDRTFRHRECKHMKTFNQEVRKAEIFAELQYKYDARLNGQADTQRCYYELSFS